jgi:TonB family protein
MRSKLLLLLPGALLLTGCETPGGAPAAPAAQHKPVPHGCGRYGPHAHGDGNTRLSFVINIEGSIEDIAVIASSGSEEVDKASMGCATHWRYFPKTVDGTPVATKWSAEIDWQGGRDKVIELGPVP